MKNFLILCLLCSLAFAVENPSVDSAFVKTPQDSLVQKDSLVVVDTVSAKIEIIRKAKEANVPVISCMGTGNKLHTELFEITDIYKKLGLK